MFLSSLFIAGLTDRTCGCLLSMSLKFKSNVDDKGVSLLCTQK